VNQTDFVRTCKAYSCKSRIPPVADPDGGKRLAL